MTNAGESLRGRKPLYMIDGIPQSSPLREGGRDGHVIDSATCWRAWKCCTGRMRFTASARRAASSTSSPKRPTDSLQQSLNADGTFQTHDIGESGDYGIAYSISDRFGNADVLASLSLRSSGIGYDANGQVIGADNTQGDTMDSKTRNAFLKSGYEWSGQRLELMFNLYDIEGNNDWISGTRQRRAGHSHHRGERHDRRRRGAQQGHQHRPELLERRLSSARTLRAQVYRQDLESTYGAEATPLATFQDPTYGPNLIDQSQNNSEKLGPETHAREGSARRAAAEPRLRPRCASG